jgi:hypothetical protein
MRRSLRRPFAVVASTVAAALLFAAPADAQRKKTPAKKKPAATAPAKPKPDTTKPATTDTTPATDDTKATKKTPAPAAEEETEKPKESEKEKEKEPEHAADSGNGAGAKPILLDLGVGIRGFQRHLGYKDDWYGVLPSYDLNGAPEGDINVGVFPIKTPTGGLTAGLVGSFGYAFALGSTYKVPPMGSTTATKYTTKAMQFSVGAQANFIFGTSSVSVAVEYGGQSYAVDLPPPSAANAQVPDVDYRFVRPNVSARLGVADKLAIRANVGYLVVLSAGEIVSDAYFASKNASVGGVDASVGIAYELAPHFEIRPSLDIRRYFYKFSWSPASDILKAPYPAGGAIDQYYGISLMAGFRF